MREGSALLQGLVTCGHCGRRLHVHYRGRNSAPGYHCAGKDLVAGRGVYCLHVGGMVIEQAVVCAFLQAITPAAIEAVRRSVEQIESNHDAALSQWRLESVWSMFFCTTRILFRRHEKKIVDLQAAIPSAVNSSRMLARRFS